MFKLVLDYAVSVLNILILAAGVVTIFRGKSILRWATNGIAVQRDLEHANERIREKDLQNADLMQVVKTGAVSRDGLRDQIVYLSSKVDTLEARIEDLSHKLDKAMSKYDAAILHIVNPKEQVPELIIDDVDHVRRHLSSMERTQ